MRYVDLFKDKKPVSIAKSDMCISFSSIARYHKVLTLCEAGYSNVDISNIMSLIHVMVIYWGVNDTIAKNAQLKLTQEMQVKDARCLLVDVMPSQYSIFKNGHNTYIPIDQKEINALQDMEFRDGQYHSKETIEAIEKYDLLNGDDK